MTEPLTVAQMRQLVAPLNPNRVANRKQGGTSLSYLETWDVRATLIRIFGFGGWSADLLEPVNIIDIREVPRKTPTASGQAHNFSVTAMATVRLSIPQLGCTYTESAVANQVGPDIGEVADFATKTAESDALKRAAVNLGTQTGLSLYDSGNTADVVRVVLAPGQAEILKEVREPKKSPGPTTENKPDASAPAEVSVGGGYVNGEGDYHESDTKLFDEPDPKSLDQAKDQIRGAFGG